MEIKEIVSKDLRYDSATGRYVSCEVKKERIIYSEDDKRSIVKDYVTNHIPASEIVKTYRLSSKHTLFTWMDMYLHEDLLSLPDNQTDEEMAKVDPQDKIRKLEAENRELRESLRMEQLKAKAYDTMITQAEQTFNIPVRKKSGTKQ